MTERWCHRGRGAGYWSTSCESRTSVTRGVSLIPGRPTRRPACDESPLASRPAHGRTRVVGTGLCTSSEIAAMLHTWYCVRFLHIVTTTATTTKLSYYPVTASPSVICQHYRMVNVGIRRDYAFRVHKADISIRSSTKPTSMTAAHNHSLRFTGRPHFFLRRRVHKHKRSLAAQPQLPLFTPTHLLSPIHTTSSTPLQARLLSASFLVRRGPCDRPLSRHCPHSCQRHTNALSLRHAVRCHPWP